MDALFEVVMAVNVQLELGVVAHKTSTITHAVNFPDIGDVQYLVDATCRLNNLPMSERMTVCRMFYKQYGGPDRKYGLNAAKAIPLIHNIMEMPPDGYYFEP
jgi:hypothetical protein